MRRNRAYPLLTILLAPALIGASCDPVDLGGNPDAATSPDAGPAPTDAGTPTVDASTPGTDAGSLPIREAAPSGRYVLVDVFDGATSYLSFDLGVGVTAPMGEATHDVRPKRLELLAADDTVLFTFPLDDSAPLAMSGYDDVRGAQSFRAFLTSTVADVPPVVADACATDTYPGRLLNGGFRVVVEVDGREASQVQRWPAGTGGFPPARPMVLCHHGVRIERTYEGFHNAFLGFWSRPDGAHDVELWESVGGATYTASSPIRAIAPDVRVSPSDALFWPSHFPTFDEPMGFLPCAGAGCTITDVMTRYVDGAASVPMQIPSSSSPYWCEQPAAGDLDQSRTNAWPPSAPSTGAVWECRLEGTGGDGAGFMAFEGTTDAGPLHVELFVGGAQWYYGEASLP